MNNIKAELTILKSLDSIALSSYGNWTNIALKSVTQELSSLPLDYQVKALSWNFSNVKEFDSAGIIVVIKVIKKCMEFNISYDLTGLKPHHKKMLDFYLKNCDAKRAEPHRKIGFIKKSGERAAHTYQNSLLYISFIGEIFFQLFKTALNPSLFRLRATLHQIEISGYGALPIITLTSFLVGLVIAYQSAEQLSKFGANIFIVEMVSISMFRELSPMIAAIVIAGRSASSFTAEIGTMKITEEIDAMKVMGLNPYRFLVLPRIIALVISMPLIVFFADIIGVFGGMIIAKTELGITFYEFTLRVQSEVDMKHILIGLIKAPFFGLVIASIGTFRGFQVSGSTDSIGYYTTVSVVNAIFWVIAINALISVLLTEVGI